MDFYEQAAIKLTNWKNIGGNVMHYIMEHTFYNLVGNWNN
jgi:hypothetical protein